MRDELPEGWTWARLADVADRRRNAFTIGPFGSNLKVSDYRDAGVPLVFVRDIRAERFGGPNTRYVSAIKAVELAAHAAQPGDLLVTKMGEPPGDTAIYPPDRPAAIITADCIKLTPNREVTSSGFLRLSIRAPIIHNQIVEQTMGVAQQKLSLARFKEVSTPLAPLPEQHRIVEKVEALLEQVNRAKERLDRVPLILKRFRQAVLAAACSGQLCDAREAEVEGPLDFLPALPHGWRWMTAQEACCRVVDCHNKTAPYTESGIRLLRTTNIRGGKLVLDDTRYVSEETYKFWSRRCPPAPGDVLFTREAPMGEAALIPDGMKVCMGQRMMLLRANGEVLLPEYLLLAVQAPYVRKYAEHVAVGSGVLHMRVGDVERLPIPVPPVAEQAALVTTARAAFSFLDKIEGRVYQVARIAEQLPQSILSKAFSGELVPTEAELARLEGRTYETAEELLKRVIALGSDVPSKGKGRGRRARKEE